MVKWLIDICALYPAIIDKDRRSPIHNAIICGHHEIVEFLVEYDGSLISSIDGSNNEYPLHAAVYMKNSECILVLLKHGADVLQRQPKSQRNSLHVAIEFENGPYLLGEMCKFLLTNS